MRTTGLLPMMAHLRSTILIHFSWLLCWHRIRHGTSGLDGSHTDFLHTTRLGTSQKRHAHSSGKLAFLEKNRSSEGADARGTLTLVLGPAEPPDPRELSAQALRIGDRLASVSRERFGEPLVQHLRLHVRQQQLARGTRMDWHALARLYRQGIFSPPLRSGYDDDALIIDDAELDAFTEVG